MNKRWYDREPTLSLAISILNNLKETEKEKCAQFIIEKVKSLNVKVNSDCNFVFNFALKRKSDNNESFATAMLALRSCDENLQKEIALILIQYIQDLEKNIV